MENFQIGNNNQCSAITALWQIYASSNHLYPEQHTSTIDDKTDFFFPHPEIVHDWKLLKK